MLEIATITNNGEVKNTLAKNQPIPWLRKKEIPLEMQQNCCQKLADLLLDLLLLFWGLAFHFMSSSTLLMVVHHQRQFILVKLL